MKPPAGSIKSWADLEKLFLARFFEDDTEISVPTLLAIKQKKGESIKMFVKKISEYGTLLSQRHNPVYWLRHVAIIYKLPSSLKWE